MDGQALASDVPMRVSAGDAGDSEDGTPLSRPGAAGEGNTEWWEAAFIISAIILGLGVLGLPWAFSKLGWGLGFLCTAVSCLGAIYSGLTVDAAIRHMKCTPHTYPEIGEAAFGARGRVAVKLIQYGFLSGCLVAVQLTASKSLVVVVEASGTGTLCLVLAQLIVALVMLPVMQVRSLGAAGKMAALPGVIAIIVPLAIILGRLPSEQHFPTAVGFPSGMYAQKNASGFEGFSHGLTTIAFAYQGQQILPELRSEMRQPSQFPLAIYASTALMSLVYVVVACTGYHYLGSGSQYLMDVLKHQPGPNAVSNAFLIVHVLVGYVINGNVMNRAICTAITDSPACKRKLLAKGITDAGQSKKVWLMATLVTLSMSFVVANLLPMLSAILGLVGATFGYTLTFIFPPLFWLKLVPPAEQSAGMRACHFCVLGATAVVMSVGTWAEVDRLLDVLEHPSSPPFAC